MRELVLYPGDTPTQAFVEKIAGAKIGLFIDEYTVGTGDGGQQVKDEESLPLLAKALKGLIEECETAARAEFKDGDPAAIRRDAEEVVMRKALIYLSERAEVSKLQEILGLSADTKARLEKFLQ
ncbi:MAG: hypothetical protein WC285_04525 [Candidatus Gracilibacteria bacterium]|jgi:hypothetical protein